MLRSRRSIRFAKPKAAENQNDRKRKLEVRFISSSHKRVSRNRHRRSSIWTSPPRPKSRRCAASDPHSQNELLPIAIHSVHSEISPGGAAHLTAPAANSERIGEILVREGLITREQLNLALQEQRDSGARI